MHVWCVKMKHMALKTLKKAKLKTSPHTWWVCYCRFRWTIPTCFSIPVDDSQLNVIGFTRFQIRQPYIALGSIAVLCFVAFNLFVVCHTIVHSYWRKAFHPFCRCFGLWKQNTKRLLKALLVNFGSWRWSQSRYERGRKTIQY